MSRDVSGIITWLRGFFDNIYQSKLVSGSNIKTINNNSLLGSGNINIQGGGGNVDIATSWGNITSDSKVPSEKLVKNNLDMIGYDAYNYFYRTYGSNLFLLTMNYNDEEDVSLFSEKLIYNMESDKICYFDTGVAEYDEIVRKSELNNKANLNHTHLKGDINFQTTSSSFNIYLYADQYMSDRNNFEIPANGQLTLDFTDLLVYSYQDYVSFNINGTNGVLSLVYIFDSHADVLYTLDSSYDIRILKITGGYEVLVYDSGDIPTSYEVNSPIIYISNQSNAVITGYFSSKIFYRKATWLDMIYPIGSIYISTQNRNPSLYFGGEWEQIQDRFLLASSSTYAIGTTGGEATHILTENEMPSHTHTQNAHNHKPNNTSYGFFTGDQNIAMTSKKALVSGTGNYSYLYGTTQGTVTEPNTTADTTATNQNKGGGQAHNNMPPYLVVSVWERIS